MLRLFIMSIEIIESHVNMSEADAESSKEKELKSGVSDILEEHDKPNVEILHKTENTSQEQDIETVDVIPSYDCISDGILQDKCEIEQEEEEQKPMFVCWNCGGNHNVTECKKERDHQVIYKNKIEFLKNKPTSVRFHKESDQKYAGVKPGVISNALREALGLQEWQAPQFVYRMRVLGYPPGWLKDAEVHRAGVALFDDDGSVLSHPEDEEGEVDRPSFQYDTDKLVSYPGFNVHLDDSIHDEGRNFGCPPMLHWHRRNEFERAMKENLVEKRKKSERNSINKRQKMSKSDVEISDIDLTIECVESASNQDEFKGNDLTAETIDSKEVGSGSDSEKGLNCGTAANTLEKSSAIVGEIEEPATGKPAGVTITPSGNIVTPSTPVTGEKSLVHRSHSKSYNYGIGFPTCSTDKTPPVEKWSVGISGHIDFENVPNSTGKWNKINKIMCRVRLEMANAKEDDQ